jgi:gamma-glutamylcyclotransferase (GGCT)/AIG2-like uncharacterized protein YtfP
MNALPIKIFVYGTLMRGFSNHHVISSCAYLGTARTVEKYSLFVGSFPFVNSGTNVSHIYGELYEVTEIEHLQHLDELEGHPDYYCRTDCQVILMEGGDGNEVIAAQIYFNNNDSMEDAEHVPTGSFRDSSASVKHRLCSG